jgi:5'-nucleotidase
MGSSEGKLILITNDDGIEAKGIVSLTEAVAQLGKIVVAAPVDSQSGMSQAITVKHPLRIKKTQLNGIERYGINGTPTDCVKLAINQLLPRKPDLLVSGINHGSNSSASVLYSGTLGAALEGCINGIASIGFSLMSWESDADFSTAKKYAHRIASKVIEKGLPKNTCLNINIPAVSGDQIRGIRVCRQTIGFWQEEFEKRTDPGGRDYFWLTGKYHNTEPDAEDTDEWALKNNYIAVVPIHIDLTCYSTIELLKNWDF